MATFAEAPEGDVARGEKIFKTKCAQCHVAEAGGGHKQVLWPLPERPPARKTFRACDRFDELVPQMLAIGTSPRTPSVYANA